MKYSFFFPASSSSSLSDSAVSSLSSVLYTAKERSVGKMRVHKWLTFFGHQNAPEEDECGDGDDDNDDADDGVDHRTFSSAVLDLIYTKMR